MQQNCLRSQRSPLHSGLQWPSDTGKTSSVLSKLKKKKFSLQGFSELDVIFVYILDLKRVLILTCPVSFSPQKIPGDLTAKYPKLCHFFFEEPHPFAVLNLAQTNFMWCLPTCESDGTRTSEGNHASEEQLCNSHFYLLSVFSIIIKPYPYHWLNTVEKVFHKNY